MAQQGVTPRDEPGIRTDYDRPGPEVTAEGLPASRRGSVSVIQAVRAVFDPQFAGDPIEADDIIITDQDAAVARLVMAVLTAVGPQLNPTGAGPAREAPAETFQARAIVLNDTATVVQLAGEDYDRRRLRIFVHAGRIFVGPTRASVENIGQDQAGGAFSMTGASTLTLETTGEVWVKLVNTNTIPCTVFYLSERGNTRNVPDLGSLAHDAPHGSRDPRHERGHVRR